MNEGRKQEVKIFIFIALALFAFLSLVTYNANDVSFVSSTVNPNTQNLAGKAGAYFAWFLYTSCGISAYLFPILALFWAFTEATEGLLQRFSFRILGSFILFISSAGLLSLISVNNSAFRFRAGGIFGLLFSNLLQRYFGIAGSYLILITLIVLSLHVATDYLIWPLMVMLFRKIKIISSKAVLSKLKTTKLEDVFNKEKKDKPRINISKPTIKSNLKQLKTEIEKIIPHKKIEPQIKKQAADLSMPIKSTRYELPPLDLLNLPSSSEEERVSEGNLQAKAKVLEDTLRDFGIEVKVLQIDRGPVVTRFELQPAAGVKVQRIVSLSDDIALAMKAISLRVVAPIPGKDRVGIELPNPKTTIVSLREILESATYKRAREKSKLTLAIGKDIAGESVVCDLGSMPHLLIAGTTGSGKTVCVNSIITSFLFNTRPDEVKFIMVDPKMVELAPFNGIPHLLSPVITKPKKVSAALDWTVSEMEARYELFAKEGSRNIEIYNKKVPKDKKLYYLIIIIDELADLMAVSANEIENAITRLSQLSRAVGIHMILATQRPSVDVVTGVIKANFPTRISFKVSSKVDSRTVLDANGADKLIGNGDMLFLPPGSSKLIRAQGPLVTDNEIEKLVNYIKNQTSPSYNQEILERQKQAVKHSYRIDKKDELHEDAVRIILETGHASVSMLQRRLALGYTRAARLIDAMEAEGIVGSYRGSKPREILVNREEYLKKLSQKNYG